MDRLALPRVYEKQPFAMQDVGYRVKSWGRRGILGGALVGFILGAAMVAIPLTANVLTFGVVGTLIVAVVEGAVIAGAFGACAAAIYSKGVHRGRSAGRGRTQSSRSRTQDIGWHEGDVPLTDFPTKWVYPNPPAIRAASEIAPEHIAAVTSNKGMTL